MRIALAQINPTVGDVAGNARLVIESAKRAAADGADVILFPEMCLLGYPQRDLLLRECVISACDLALRSIARELSAIEAAVIVGYPRPAAKGSRKPAHNSAAIIQRGEIIQTYDKQTLPGYDVFDEDRYFEPGSAHCFFDVAGVRCAVLICEDLYRARDVAGGDNLRPHISRDLVKEVADAGAKVLLVPSASPFVMGKGARHTAQLRKLAAGNCIAIALANQVGGNDDLIFDGRSMLVNDRGGIVHRCAGFAADLAVADSDGPAVEIPEAERNAELFDALVLGIRDYVRKTGRARLTLGLSGGVDSALTAVLAAAAIGPANITGVMMPSRYSSPGSVQDAEELARRLELGSLQCIPIESSHAAMSQTIRRAIGDGAAGVTDENIQARLRGMILMAASNVDGSLVLATGNKSELAMGYCTLYGDMAGALAPLGDVLKTQVYALSRWINQHHHDCGFDRPPIPESSLSKPPSAELRPNQTDQDTLPPYDVLDEIIRRAVDLEESAETIGENTGFEASLVRSVMRTIDRSEFKRMQAAIVFKVAPRSFGPGRPMPVAMRLDPPPRQRADADA